MPFGDEFHNPVPVSPAPCRLSPLCAIRPRVSFLCTPIMHAPRIVRCQSPYPGTRSLPPLPPAVYWVIRRDGGSPCCRLLWKPSRDGRDHWPVGGFSNVPSCLERLPQLSQGLAQRALLETPLGASRKVPVICSPITMLRFDAAFSDNHRSAHL